MAEPSRLWSRLSSRLGEGGGTTSESPRNAPRSPRGSPRSGGKAIKRFLTFLQPGSDKRADCDSINEPMADDVLTAEVLQSHQQRLGLEGEDQTPPKSFSLFKKRASGTDSHNASSNSLPEPASPPNEEIHPPAAPPNTITPQGNSEDDDFVPPRGVSKSNSSLSKLFGELPEDAAEAGAPTLKEHGDTRMTFTSQFAEFQRDTAKENQRDVPEVPEESNQQGPSKAKHHPNHDKAYQAQHSDSNLADLPQMMGQEEPNITDAMVAEPVSDAFLASSADAQNQRDGNDDDGDDSGSEGTSESESEPEAEGEFKGGKGDFLTSRYRIEDEVGRGTFGRVLQCHDKKTSKQVAVKVVHDAGRYYELSLIEAEILRDVNALGGRGVTHCVMLLNFFKFQGHACMVFEPLGLSLFEFLKTNDYVPFPLYCVQGFARQMLEAIAFLHAQKLIHTDLKPENLLLVDARYRVQQVGKRKVRIPESTRIKLIDFGCATYDDDDHKSDLIATRQYRAPEVILGLDWSYPSDLWSIGCIVAELYSGDQLFETHSNMEHIALIERGVGRWPEIMLSQSEMAEKYFDPRNQLSIWRTSLDAEGRRHVRAMKSLEDFVGEDKDTGLLSFFRALLTIDPDERISAERALHKSFLRPPKSRSQQAI